jgi:hypothetical protein
MMKITLTFVLAIFISISSIAQDSRQNLATIFSTDYMGYLISQGDNFPDFDRKKDNIDRFLVSLSYGIAPEDFAKKAGWSESMLSSKIKFLTDKNWLKNDSGRLTPTIFIVSGETGRKLFEYAKPLSEAIAKSIASIAPSMKKSYLEKGLVNVCNFDDISFLILSDVLLDNWQIMEMESAFLKQENRPLRHGKHYYAALMENGENGYEPFRIYGNQSGRINDSTYLNIYGNNRISVNRMLSTKYYRDSVMSASLKLTPELYKFFDDASAGFKPELISILEKNRSYSMKVFKDSGYSNQIRFEEFFIWWYHFIYTESTNILARKGIIKLPASGNFIYL